MIVEVIEGICGIIEGIWGIIKLIYYLIDLGKDCYINYLYYYSGDLWWAELTSYFILIPNVVAYLMLVRIFCIYNDCPLILVCSPIIPLFIWLNGYIYFSIFCTGIYTVFIMTKAIFYPRSPVGRSFEGLKLVLAYFQSFSMASLQMHIAFRAIHNGEVSEYWHYFTMGWSLISIMLTLITNAVLKDTYGNDKGGFVLAGLLAIASRTMVFCLFSMINPILFFILLFVEWLVYIIVSYIFGSIYSQNLENAFIFSLSVPYDNFSTAGRAVSLINLGFAFICYTKTELQTVATPSLISLILSIISLVVSRRIKRQETEREWLWALLNMREHIFVQKREKKGLL